MSKKKTPPPRPVVNVVEMPEDLLRELVQLVAASKAIDHELLKAAEALMKAGEATAQAANAQIDLIRTNRKRLEELHKKAQEEEPQNEAGPAHPDEGGY